MKRNKKCCLRNLCFWQCRLIIGITAWLSAASFSPAFGQVYPSSVCPKTNCKWHDEYVIVTLPGEDVEKEADKLLKVLSKAIGVAAQVANLQKAIKKIGPAGDNPSVIVVYICYDPTTMVTLTKKETLGADSVWWAAKMDKAKDEAAKDRDKERARAIRALCGGNCCKVTPTPSPSPSPSPPTPTPTPKPSPPRTYTGPGQTPTPTPQEHGMVPRQPGKTGETCAVLIATGKIKVETSGTGETIGHVADLKIQNSTDQPLTCAVPPMILESGSGKNQHYACPSGQTVALNPHQTKTVPMNGVCLNRNKPPVGKGVSGDLVINEANPTAPQNPNSHLSPADAGKLLRICTSKYDAADNLQKDGALKNLPYKDKQKQKDIVVQWSTWCDPRISQITGAPPATKDDLKKVVYKQVQEKGPMSPETTKKVDQGIDTIFEKVELTTAKAKDLEKPNPFANVELTGEEGKGESSPPTQSPSPSP